MINAIRRADGWVQGIIDAVVIWLMRRGFTKSFIVYALSLISAALPLFILVLPERFGMYHSRALMGAMAGCRLFTGIAAYRRIEREEKAGLAPTEGASAFYKGLSSSMILFQSDSVVRYREHFEVWLVSVVWVLLGFAMLTFEYVLDAPNTPPPRKDPEHSNSLAPSSV